MRSSAAPIWLVAVLLAAGIGLILVPEEIAARIRCIVRDGLRPGQAVVQVGWGHGVNLWAGIFRRADDSDAVREMREQLVASESEARRWAATAGALMEQSAGGMGTSTRRLHGEGREPLFVPQLVTARVLGEETAALWRGKKLLGVGEKSGVVESALVLEDTRPLVDQGAETELSEGDAVYAGRIVIGKIAAVGRYTSTLRRITDPDYTGRARLARRTSQGLVFGAEGTIFGDGSELCGLKHITDPVNVGDEVYTGGTDGVLPLPMYYGKVVHAELEPGAREWTIQIEPAAANVKLHTVQVLRTAINPARILTN